MSASAVWAVAGLAVAALEMLAPGFFLLWVGLAMLGTGVVGTVVDLGWEAQVGTFLILTVGLVGAVGMRLRRGSGVDRVNAPAAGLIGQTCRAIAFRGQEGRVSLGDGTWYARIVPGGELGPPFSGEALRVVGLDGTTLLVSKGVNGRE